MGLYPEYHLYLKVLLYVAAQVSVVCGYRLFAKVAPAGISVPRTLSRSLKIVTGVVLAGAIVFSMLGFDRSVRVSSLLLSRTNVVAAVVGRERAILDFDWDGYSAVYGGGDCNDLEPDINPGHLEVLDNGIDDNCHGGDLSSQSLMRHTDDLREQRKKISSWWATHPKNQHRRYNVLLITIDALRADHVGAWGYDRATTPRIDELAKRSWVFERTYCQGGWTSISLPSLLKGMNPSEIEFTNVYEDSFLRLWFPGEVPRDANILKMFTVPAHDKNESIAQILQREGYRTVAVLNDDITDYFQEKFGYIRGFDFYYHNNLSKVAANPELKRRRITAQTVTKMAIEELDQMPQDRPFFMWLHHFDPHGPYYDTKFNKWGSESMDFYDGEIAYTDKYVGDLLDEFHRRGLGDNTIVIVTADHGEAFGEHDTRYHGMSGYQEEIHVPLIVSVPGFEAARISDNAALVDILPTVLDLNNIRTDHPFSGRSLLPMVLDGPSLSRREVVSMTWRYSLAGARISNIKTLLLGGKKIVYDEVGQHWLMFDLEKDPGETENLADTSPEEFDNLKSILMSYSERDYGGRVELR